jgi:hypothetical protein
VGGRCPQVRGWPEYKLGDEMPYIADFNVDEILGALKSISDKHPEGSRERDVIELAQIAMIFPRHIRKEDAFRDYYKEFFDPSFEVSVSHEFSTRDEANEWLVSGKARDAERVKIAGQGFMVVELSKSKRLVFMTAPLPCEFDEHENGTDED